MIEVCAVNCIEDFDKNQFDRLLGAVDKDKQIRIKRFAKYEDAQRTLIADILTRLMLCARLDMPPHKIEFSCNAYGKPYLKTYGAIHFNASHSGNWIVCAIDAKPLGIDIEHIKPIDLHIAERFFSVEENKVLEYTANDKKLEYFYDLWTLKESYIKALGKGLSLPLDSFSILKYEECIVLKSIADTNTYYFKQYAVDRNYKLSVCGISSTFGDIRIYNCEQIYNYFSNIGGFYGG